MSTSATNPSIPTLTTNASPCEGGIQPDGTIVFVLVSPNSVPRPQSERKYNPCPSTDTRLVQFGPHANQVAHLCRNHTWLVSDFLETFKLPNPWEAQR
jgi:hypothetical protein